MKIVPPELFGRDHWSMLSYCESIAVKGSGMVDASRLTTHTGKLRDGTAHPGHKGTDVLHDLEEAHFINIECGGYMTVISMTKAGRTAAQNLRENLEFLSTHKSHD